MSSSEQNTCPHCGTTVPAGSTDQPCPACLLSGAVDTLADTLPIDTQSPSFPGPQPQRTPDPAGFPKVFGPYRLLAILGRGGMGTVYDAEQISTGRRVALKILSQQLDTPDMRQRFLREGRLAAAVSHPNSLYIFGSDEIDGVPVITMEIAPGGTLKDKLTKRGSLPVTEAVDAILDVISGLEAAFAGGVLHRDVKPSNCFLDPDGSVKVGDFGLSVSIMATEDTYLTATGVIMGTPAYAPPEQLRGDDLDLRADIYSVGATLFTLLTNNAPFEGKNAVQVVANAMNQKPKPVSEFRSDVPPGLDRAVARCLAKEPDNRFTDYTSLRKALLPFSSQEPEPASLKARVPAGWIDYLIAFLIPYLTLMLAVGPEEFHNRPLVDRTLFAFRFHIAFLSFGFLYFTVTEGVWGAGLGKRLIGLKVVGANGRPPGVVRALARIIIPFLAIEGVRIPFLLATISPSSVDAITGSQAVLLIGASNVCPWLAVLLTLKARRENGFATVWDRLTRTRVVFSPKGISRPSMPPTREQDTPAEEAPTAGPYQTTREIVPGRWIAAYDPVLRRQVWLIQSGPSPTSASRRKLSRPGRMRWLQQLSVDAQPWDAFEATNGTPLPNLIEEGGPVPWGTLRHWLHDLASELWTASSDRTLPPELSLDHVWIAAHGNAILLDQAWPEVSQPATTIDVSDLAGQQHFLNTFANCAEPTSIPLHARPVLRNLQQTKFEKLSFLTGSLRGLLDKPAEVTTSIRTGALFMMPLYIGILVLVGVLQSPVFQENWLRSSLITIFSLLGLTALIQFVFLPLRWVCSHEIFGLSIINSQGEKASRTTLLKRWMIIWLPLLVPAALLAIRMPDATMSTAVAALSLLTLWIGAALYTTLHPNRGLHDLLSNTWTVRR